MTRARDLGDFIADGAAAELVVDTTTLVVDSTNNRVGIGTASPSQALDVVGTLAVTGNATISSTSGDSLILTKDTTEPSLRIEGDSNKDFVFTISGELLTITQNDGATDIVTFDHDTKASSFFGKVGIGTSSIDGTHKLQVEETAASTGVGIKIESHSWDSTLTLANGSHSWEILNDYSNSSSLAFYSSQGAATRLVIDSSGNVIIGETSPINGGNLNVATSAADATISALCRSTTDSHGVTVVLQKSSTNSGNFAATADGENLGKILFRGVNTSTVSKVGAQISVVQNGTDSSTVPADMVFTTKEAERFRMGSLGQLGIGGATYGTAGQVLTSGGSGAAPTWADASSGGMTQITSGTIGTNAQYDFSLGSNWWNTYKYIKIIYLSTFQSGDPPSGTTYCRFRLNSVTSSIYVYAGQKGTSNNASTQNAGRLTAASPQDNHPVFIQAEIFTDGTHTYVSSRSGSGQQNGAGFVENLIPNQTPTTFNIVQSDYGSERYRFEGTITFYGVN